MQAAVLAHGIAESQSFVDGNKRLALASMLVFLELNGWLVEASDDQKASWMLDLAYGLTVETFADRLRESSMSLWDD
jgi:death on curing protein